MRYTLMHWLLRALLVAVMCALGLLVVVPHSDPITPGLPSVHRSASSVGVGPGIGYGAGGGALSPALPGRAAVCSPLDVTCLAQAALSALLTPIVGNLNSFSNALLKDFATALTGPGVSANIITQTPLCFSRLFSTCVTSRMDATIAPFMLWAQLVASSALGFIVVVGSLSLLFGRHFGLRMQGISEFIPRVALTALSATLAPGLVQAMIDLNNLLCQGVLQITALSALAAQIVALVNPLAPLAGPALLFLVVAVVMIVLLIGQMTLRLAYVSLLGGLAPLGLLCFALPQTLSWGRLWMQQLSLAIFVQFLQVSALGLGGMLIAALSVTITPIFVGIPDATFIVESLLLIMLLFLAFRLPTLLQSYAARSITREVHEATIETLDGAGKVASEVIALL